MLTIKNCNTIFLPNSAISFRDRYLLIDFMLLFRPIWQKAPTSMMKVERAVRESDHQTIMGCISDISGRDYISQRTSEKQYLIHEQM